MKLQEHGSFRNKFPSIKMFQTLNYGTTHGNSGSLFNIKLNRQPCSLVLNNHIKFKYIDIKGKRHAKHIYTRAKDFLGFENMRF
jgi:hypothetical protein